MCGLDRKILLEALSVLVGVTVKSLSDAPSCILCSARHGSPSPDVLNIQDLLSATYFGDEFWQDVNFWRTSVRSMPTVKNDLFIDEDEFFDAKWDYDFTRKKDTKTFRRGGEEYKRPYGWMRFGLKVAGKYPNGNCWLGTSGYRTHSDPHEWPVCYHGTSLDGAKGIISTNYKAGSREKYGRGVYSTPDPKVAEQYCGSKEFVSKVDGKTYIVCLQNRINPRVRQICARSDYWLLPVPEGTPSQQERDIVMGALRPYSLLVKRA